MTSSQPYGDSFVCSHAPYTTSWQTRKSPACPHTDSVLPPSPLFPSPGLWQRHTHKVSCMRAAFKGMVLHTRPQLLRTGLWAFVLNLREAQRQRQRLGGCLDYWRNLTRRNLEVRSVQKKIRLVRPEGREESGGKGVCRHLMGDCWVQRPGGDCCCC